MSRIIIQLCALLCLIASLSAEPSCKDSKDVEKCNILLHRWNALQELIQGRKCPILQPGFDGYDECMKEVNKEAIDQLTFEVETNSVPLEIEQNADILLYSASLLEGKAESKLGVIQERKPHSSSGFWDDVWSSFKCSLSLNC